MISQVKFGMIIKSKHSYKGGHWMMISLEIRGEILERFNLGVITMQITFQTTKLDELTKVVGEIEQRRGSRSTSISRVGGLERNQ